MKNCKRLSALLLALLLAFGIVPFCTAEADNPAMPIITKQPESLTVKCCEEFTLSVEAYIPNGDELQFRWRRNESSYHRQGIFLSGGEFSYNATITIPHLSRNTYFHCQVHNKTNYRNGNSLNAVLSDLVYITVEICPNMPVITKHPEYAVNKYGKTTFSVDAHIPSGDPIGYDWDWWPVLNPGNNYPKLNQNGSTAVMSFIGVDRLFYSKNSYKVNCVIFNAKDSTERSGPHRIRSKDALVTLTLGPIGRIFGVLYLPMWAYFDDDPISYLFYPLVPFSFPFFCLAHLLNLIFRLDWF